MRGSGKRRRIARSQCLLKIRQNFGALLEKKPCNFAQYVEIATDALQRSVEVDGLESVHANIAYWHIGRNSSEHNSMPIPEPEQRSSSVPAEFRYLLSRPECMKTNPIAILAMHGYGSNPHTMLRLTRAAVGPDHPIASIEAPNQFYLRAPGGETGYNWGVSDHAHANIALHHYIVLSTIARMKYDLGIEASRCVLLGFSQPCGLNYRFIATHIGRAGGVIALCGGVPHDWETGAFLTRVTCPVLHISRDADEFYPLEKVTAFPNRLRLRIQELEFHILPGAHRFPSQGGSIIRDWLDRHFQA